MTLDVYDNGTGMDFQIVNSYLLSAGSESFWRTERSFDEWGVNIKNNALIAEHGIGFFSVFMIAKSVEVFTKYPDKQEIDLYIVNPHEHPTLEKRQINEFPEWRHSLLDIKSPWAHNHGTCIRMNLKENISSKELVNFVSDNIPRIRFDLIVSVNGEAVHTKKLWYFRSNHGYKKDKSFQENYERITDKKGDGFYSNPARDSSVEESHFKLGNIEGDVCLPFAGSTDEFGKNRVTQNGVLVKNAYRYLNDSKIFRILETNYSGKIPIHYDVDLSGELMLFLNAERTSPIPIKMNEQVVDHVSIIILRQLIKSIQKIEHTVFFPCGNEYYHGFDDFEQSEVKEIYFHSALRKLFSINFVEAVENRISLENIKCANLYILVTQDRNTSCSVNDLISNEQKPLLYVPHSISKNFEEIDLSDQDKAKTVVLEYRRKVVSDELRKRPLLVIPGFPNSFTIPIYTEFRIGEEKHFDCYSVYELRKRKTPMLYSEVLKERIDEKIKQRKVELKIIIDKIRKQSEDA